MTDGEGAESYAHDQLDRLSKLVRSQRAFSYDYDAASNLTQRAYPDGRSVDYAYDDDERLEQVKSAAKTTVYSYDAQDRLTEACYQASCPGAGDPFIRYAYDAVGNRSSETRPSGTTSYSHDQDDRLTARSGLLGSRTYDHDDNGNLTRAGSRSYSYDAENRTTSTSAGAQTKSYRYDGDGTRTEATAGAETTQLVWDKNNALPQLIAEENASGQPKRRYLHGHGLISMTAGGQEHYYHRDALGSVTNLTAADGSPEWSYTYEPYGAQRQTQKLDPQAPENPMRFAGQRLDENTGLYHLRARDLDPHDGRFTATDPLTPAAQSPYISAYAYADNRPTTLTDPSGLISVSGVLKDAGNAVGGAAHSLSFGASSWALDQVGLGDLLNEKSAAFGAGAVGGDLNPKGFLKHGALGVIRATKGARAADDLPAGFRPMVGGAPGAGGRAGKLRPNNDALGPHTVFRRGQDGRIDKYTTFDEFGNEALRFRGSGGSHAGLDPPLFYGPKPGKGPGSPLNRARNPGPDDYQNLPPGY